MNLVATDRDGRCRTEHHGNVALETLISGSSPRSCSALLGLVTFSYKNVANRHSAKAEAWAAQHGKDGHEAGHGH